MTLALASHVRVRATSIDLLVALAIALLGCGTETNADDATTGDDSGAPTTGASSGVTTTVTSGLDTSTGASTSGATGDTSTGVAEGTTGADATSAASSSDTGAASTSGTDTSGGTSSGSEGSSTGEPPNPACVAGCTTQVDCNLDFPSVDDCVQWCDDNLDMALLFSPACHDAWEGLSACFGTLSCEQYAEYLSPSMFPYPCSDQADALAFQCQGQ